MQRYDTSAAGQTNSYSDEAAKGPANISA